MLNPYPRIRSHFVLSAVFLLAVAALAQERPTISVRQGADGKLVYATDAAGNRVVDFSTAGYGGGGEAIPFVPPKITVAASGRRDRERIQAALDLVASMPRGADGFRGAVLLAPGRFTLEGTLQLNASGVVLRGSGQDEKGTVLVAAGNSRRTLIEIGGRGERIEVRDTRKPIADAFVPVGATKISVDDASAFPVGARVVVRRASSTAWIAQLGMNAFSGWRPENRISWAPGSRDIV